MTLTLTSRQKIALRVADLYDRRADEYEAQNMFAEADLLRSQAAAKREAL